ncbi:hypothetical protein [Kineococcus rubinsiae]|uniref:hypothetical protein n=1 Tax=Kineococcus rubinsiae TaxID=2609562 RepID=UPI0014309B87|nr:hypothetical protein [Kineococcus rubinsiae]NIZ92979.1 hypothetical protein [Kineococcus rubinsiae]
MFSDDPTHALVLGRMAQEGDTALAVLTVVSGPLGGTTGSGALAVSRERLWLTQPQLLGGPSVASVPLASVGAVTVSGGGTLLGAPRALRVEVVVDRNRLRFRTLAEREVAEAFAQAVADARGVL